MTADQVRQAQQQLKQDGDYSGAVDGKLGPKTAQAIKQFQRKNGLQQTGSLDDQTLSKLGLEQTSGYGSSTPPESMRQSGTAGAGLPSTSNPTTDTTVGASSGTSPAGEAGTLAPGNQNSGSSTGQAGGAAGGGR